MVKIVHGVEPPSQAVTGYVQMPEVRTAKVLTGKAATVLVQGPLVMTPSGVLNNDSTPARKQVSVSSVAGWEDTVEEVDPGRYSLDDIFGIADPHEVAHPVPRKPRSGEPYHRMELFGSLPDGKSANSESIEGKWRHPVDAFGP